MEQNNVLDILLRTEIAQPQEKSIKIKRLSKAAGEDVIFRLQELTFSRVAEIRGMTEKSEVDVHVVLAGVKSPNLKDKELMEKYHAITPAELVKKLLSPGEIADISRAIESLSGYQTSTIEELEKNAQTPSGT